MNKILVIIGTILGFLDLGLFLILSPNGQTVMNNAFPLAIVAIIALIMILVGIRMD